MTRRRKNEGATALESLRTTGHRKKRGLKPSLSMSCSLGPSSLGLTPNVLTHGVAYCRGPPVLANI